MVGFSRIAQAAGFERAIGFDMGGTSTDVARFDGRYELEYETEKAGVRVVAPMMAIETVAAGGGSICGFDGVKLVVGPDSAGADPGPGLLWSRRPAGRDRPEFLPGQDPARAFSFSARSRGGRGAAGDVDRRNRTRRPAGAIRRVELCDGFLARGQREHGQGDPVDLDGQGVRPARYVLVAFGGAAGQHACAVARELGMRQVLLHPDAGMLSAYGIGLADVVRHRAAGVYRPYCEAAVARTGSRRIRATRGRSPPTKCWPKGIAAERIEVRPVARSALPRTGRLADHSRAARATAPMPKLTQAEHEKLYGYRHEGRPLEIVAVRVEVVGRTADYGRASAATRRRASRRPSDRSTVCFDAARARRAGLRPRPSSARRRDSRPGHRLRRCCRPRSSIPAGRARCCRAANCC